MDSGDVVLEMDGYKVAGSEQTADGFAYNLTLENMDLAAYTVVPLIAQIH